MENGINDLIESTQIITLDNQELIQSRNELPVIQDKAKLDVKIEMSPKVRLVN